MTCGGIASRRSSALQVLYADVMAKTMMSSVMDVGRGRLCNETSIQFFLGILGVNRQEDG